MQTTAIRTVAYSLPENEAILLTLLISNRYILFAELVNFFVFQIIFKNIFGNLAQNHLEIWRKIIWKFGAKSFGNLAQNHFYPCNASFIKNI